MALPLLLLWFTSPNILNTITPQIINSKQQKNLKNENKIILENNLTKNLFSSFYLNFNKDLSIEPTILAKLILEEEENNPRLRIFEIRSEQIIKDGQKGENHFSQLPGSRHITIESLSHNGVPVHPLQFQRLLRSHSVDSNSIIILYDKHPLGLMSSYALWIFRLYGHNSTFFLNGGASAWHSYLTNKNTNNLLNNSKIEEKLLMTNGGDFRANWREDLVATFDDLLAAFEPTDEGDVSAKVDIVDAQKPEEFDGHIVGGSKSSFSSSSSSTSSISTSPIAIYGHIRTAMNIPVERLFLSTPIGNQRRWASSNAHSRLFARLGLTTKRPVVVYDELSSLRAASVWAALQRANFTASLYFGAWPEWLIRAPDHLKSIPE
uniref:Rhodanese domain-containing protein n=1 Tax=Meloidogyne hapla TaxID=6305 RepID=A0A1I8B9S8_MELHA